MFAKLVLLCCVLFIISSETTTQCLNLLEKNGQCKACHGTEVLLQGYCVKRQRGCLEQLSENICLQCQSGYVLSSGDCIREALYLKLEGPEANQIPPVKISIQSDLSLEEIKALVGGDASVQKLYEKVNWHFRTQYSRQLGGTPIQNVERIETMTGMIFIIRYRSLMKIFEGIASIRGIKKQENVIQTTKQKLQQTNYQITELDFAQKKKLSTVTFQSIVSGLRMKYLDQLTKQLQNDKDEKSSISMNPELSIKLFSLTFNKGSRQFLLDFLVMGKGTIYRSVFTKQATFQEKGKLNILSKEVVQNMSDISSIFVKGLESIISLILKSKPELSSQKYSIIDAPYFSSNKFVSIEGNYKIAFTDESQKVSMFIVKQTKDGAANIVSSAQYHLKQEEKEQFSTTSKKQSQKIGNVGPKTIISKEQLRKIVQNSNSEKQNKSSQKQQEEKKQIQDIQTTELQNTGKYQKFKDLSDPIFLEIWKFVLQQHSAYENYQLIQVLAIKQPSHKTATQFKIVLEGMQGKKNERVQVEISNPANGEMRVISVNIDGKKVDMLKQHYLAESQNAVTISFQEQQSVSGYDYKNDQNFEKAYEFLTNNTKMVNMLPILKVQKFEGENYTDYEVIYAADQRAKVRMYTLQQEKEVVSDPKNLRVDSTPTFSRTPIRFNRYGVPIISPFIQNVVTTPKKTSNKTQRFEMIYYMIDGVNILDLSQSQDFVRSLALIPKNQTSLAHDISAFKKLLIPEDEIYQFLKNDQPQIYGSNNNIKYSKEKQQQLFYGANRTVFIIKTLTPSGLYEARLTPLTEGYQLLSLIKLSNENRAEISSFQPTIRSRDPVVSIQKQTVENHKSGPSMELESLDQFIRKSYKATSGLNLEVAQVGVTNTSKRFSALYSNSLRKVLQFDVEDFAGNFIVTKSAALENGYQNVPLVQNSQNNLLEQIARNKYSQFLQNCESKLRRSNETHQKIYFSCPTGSYEYIYENSTKKDELKAIQKHRDFNENEFITESLIPLKLVAADKTFQKVDAYVRQQFTQYLADSEITKVEKRYFTAVAGVTYTLYKILYRSATLGDFICEVSFNEGQIKIINFYLSVSQKTAKCQIFDQQVSKCLKCLQSYSLQYGGCFLKQQNCEIQIGNSCIQCQAKAILRNGKCVRNIYSV